MSTLTWDDIAAIGSLLTALSVIVGFAVLIGRGGSWFGAVNTRVTSIEKTVKDGFAQNEETHTSIIREVSGIRSDLGGIQTRVHEIDRIDERQRDVRERLRVLESQLASTPNGKPDK